MRCVGKNGLHNFNGYLNSLMTVNQSKYQANQITLERSLDENQKARSNVALKQSGE